MPAGDGTGPLGQGPRSGRGAGYCAGYEIAGSANRQMAGSGPVGPGFGCGRGGGAGRTAGAGGGFGHRNRFYATGAPFNAYTAPGLAAREVQRDEISLLQSESQRLKAELDAVEQRLDQLEKT